MLELEDATRNNKDFEVVYKEFEVHCIYIFRLSLSIIIFFHFIATLLFFVDSKSLLSTIQCFHFEAVPENSPLQVPSRK